MTAFPHMSASLPQLATPNEIAPLLRMHPKTVLLHLRNGSLPGKKIDGRWLVNLSVLTAQLGGLGADDAPEVES